MPAGLDPASEIGFALAMGKLRGVHLNDRNGMKFDQDYEKLELYVMELLMGIH